MNFVTNEAVNDALLIIWLCILIFLYSQPLTFAQNQTYCTVYVSVHKRKKKYPSAHATISSPASSFIHSHYTQIARNSIFFCRRTTLHFTSLYSSSLLVSRCRKEMPTTIKSFGTNYCTFDPNFWEKSIKKRNECRKIWTKNETRNIHTYSETRI